MELLRSSNVANGNSTLNRLRTNLLVPPHLSLRDRLRTRRVLTCLLIFRAVISPPTRRIMPLIEVEGFSLSYCQPKTGKLFRPSLLRLEPKRQYAHLGQRPRWKQRQADFPAGRGIP